MEYLEKVRNYHLTPEYQKAMRKRGHWVESLFGEAENFHRLRCFNLRGLFKVNIEVVMIAVGQNIRSYSSTSRMSFFSETYFRSSGEYFRWFIQQPDRLLFTVPNNPLKIPQDRILNYNVTSFTNSPLVLNIEDSTISNHSKFPHG